MIEALIDLRKKTEEEGRQLCRKKVYDQPRLRLTKYVTARDPQGGFACELELELSEWLVCTKEIEVAILDVSALEAIKTLAVVPTIVPTALPAGPGT